MVEKLQKTLRDSPVARWTALGVVAFTMLCGYFLTEAMSPLKPLLEKELLWTSSEYGIFNSGYGWFNVFLFMLILGGIVLDKMGVRFTGLTSSFLMVAGVAVKYYAITTVFPADSLILGMKTQVILAGLGYAIFGVGIEITGITVSKVIVKWFKGRELALAMGMEMATARLGSALALLFGIPLATNFSISMPILCGLILLCIGFISFTVYCVMDKKLEKSLPADTAKEDPFRPSDIMIIIRNKGFWLIAILCLLFYSAVFPFFKYATDLVIHKYGVDPSFAGSIPSLLPLGTILLTPLFGNLYDRKGRGASIMILGAIMLVIVHALFATPAFDHWIVAVIVTIILGVAFSLVPSAMWPSVPKIIPEKQLGTAYALIFWLQNIGIMGVPFLIGWVLDKYCKTTIGTEVHYDYTYPMMIFAGFGVLAVYFAFLLKAEDKKKGYGLESPNVKVKK
ncbi:MAG: MFS transporter [Odoribacteraceae bacterium]|jgi:predicted MFS family arabinose efflux permease|nr:MFS transporter [Odoribacteraceae bacterium]